MSRIERILYPTDFSNFSSQALRHALALAKKFNAPWLLTPAMRDSVQKERHQFLLPAREARIDHEVEVREGEAWREIVAAALEMRAELVVIGAQGHGALEHLLSGSSAQHVIRGATRPVPTARRGPTSLTLVAAATPSA